MTVVLHGMMISQMGCPISGRIITRVSSKHVNTQGIATCYLVLNSHEINPYYCSSLNILRFIVYPYLILTSFR